MENTRCRTKVGAWLPVVLYAGFLFYLSSLTPSQVPSLPLTDTLIHLGLYAGFGLLLSRATWRPSFWRCVALALIGSLLYGALDEFHQSFVPGRTMTLKDWVMDALGGVFGGILGGAYLLRRGFRERRSRNSKRDNPPMESL